MRNTEKTTAIIVAAGTGSRMKSDCPKQFMEVLEKPILYYTLKAFEQSKVDEVIIAASKNYISYVESEIVTKYGLEKVREVVCGGNERYESVYEGLKAVQDGGYVLVHDGARPFVTPDLINRVIEEVKCNQAVIVGVKSKDTVKIVGEDGYVQSTPDRNCVWNIQTPQAFEYNLLKNAYDNIVKCQYKKATDDAMVVEYATHHPIKVVEGDYQNIKITTPEDLNENYFRGR